MHVFRLAVNALRRDWRGGELGVLAAAIIVSVASVASVGFFTDRIRIVMDRQAAELLAADLMIASHRPMPQSLVDEARRRGLGDGEYWSFRSVVLAGDLTELAEVKAVAGAYPLRGTLRTSAELFGADQPVESGPPPGEVWLEPRLLQTLGLTPGDSITVGASTLTVGPVLSFEPDRGGEMFAIAPRLLMNLEDVPATELVQPGSHVHYRLLFAGEPEAVAAYRSWAIPNLESGQNLQGLSDARPELRTALERAGRFLGLAAMISVVLAGVAIAIAARRFAARHWDGVAIMRCVGATQSMVTKIFVWEMVLLALLAGLVGAALGFLAQELLARILNQVVAGELPLPSVKPLFPALLTGAVALLGFGLPPILQLRGVPPVRVLRRDVGGWRGVSWWTYAGALLGVSGLMLWQAADAELAAWVLGGSLATLIVLALASWLMVRGLGRLRGRVGIAWRFGFANIARRGWATVAQVVALGLGIMVLLVLTLVRNDMLAAWRDSLPPGAPNHFLINIQQHEVRSLDQFLSERGVETVGLYAMVRGRLSNINERTVVPSDYQNPRAKRLAEREFNLSWSSALQEDNRIVGGKWWGEGVSEPQISIEEGIAETLGIKLGDTLTFNIAGVVIEAPVTSVREVKWDSFHPNFFVLFPPGVLEEHPSNWITSFHVGGERQALLTELVRTFPSVTVLDIDALMERVRSIIDRVSLAVEYVFGFTLLAGLVVLFAAVQATRDERVQESAMLRTLGARRGIVIRSLFAEFATLGMLAGTLAAFAASALGIGLGEFLFGFGYGLDPTLWVIGSLLGVLGVGIAGLAATRGVLDQPPMQVLRSEG